ncbi:AAA family ATPase [Dactylosporangium darangshiense]|uniref:AAA family ATPase n=1 Tax=Dactylosporangium darangshiense TaxID=579108 RepID=UPI00362DC5A1
MRKLRMPLVAEPVRLEGSAGLRGRRVVPAGDLEVTPLIADAELAAVLESAPGLGTAAWLGATGTPGWVETAAEAAGLKPDRIAADDTPIARLPDGELVGQAAAALYVVRDVSSAGLRDTLRAWSARAGLEDTALAVVYGGAEPVGEFDTAGESVEPGEVYSPLPLNAAQRDVVRRVRRERIVVVSGPPGNGKSHALVAAALDTVYRGGSVLVATQAPHAAEVLGELLSRYPGAEPVLFGDAERRDRFAQALAAGRPAGVQGRELQRRRDEVDAAAAAVGALEAGVGAALELERKAATMAVWEPLLAGLRAEAPRVFGGDFDVPKAKRLWLLGFSARCGSGGWPGSVPNGCRRCSRRSRPTARRRPWPLTAAPISVGSGRRCWPPTSGCAMRSARRCATPRRRLPGGAVTRCAPPVISGPRCAPGATGAVRPSRSSTGPRSCARCRCGWAPSPTSRTCCRRRQGCSTW